jgi:hypothetical protein
MIGGTVLPPLPVLHLGVLLVEKPGATGGSFWKVAGDETISFGEGEGEGERKLPFFAW